MQENITTSFWNDDVWKEYLNHEASYRDSPFGEVNGDYVGAIDLHNFVYVEDKPKVISLYEHFTETISDIAV